MWTRTDIDKDAGEIAWNESCSMAVTSKDREQSRMWKGFQVGRGFKDEFL